MTRIPMIFSILLTLAPWPTCWAQQRQFGYETGRNVAFSPSGKLFAVSHSKLELWNVRGKLLATIEKGKGLGANIAFSADGEILASAGKEGVRLWDVRNAQDPKVIPPPKQEKDVFAVAFSSNGDLLAWRSSTAVTLWHLKKREIIKTMETPGNYYGEMWISFRPNGDLLAWANPKEIFLWNVKDLTHGKIDVESYGTPAFNPKDDNILAWREKKKLTLWDIKAKKVSDQFDIEARALSSGPVFSPEGKRLVTVGTLFTKDGRPVSGDADTLMIDVDSGLVIKTFLTPYHVRSMAFSPNGEILLLASGEKLVQHYVGPYR